MTEEASSHRIRVFQIPNLGAQLVAQTISTQRLHSGEWWLPLIADDSASDTAYLLERAGMVALSELPLGLSRGNDPLRLAFGTGAPDHPNSSSVEVWALKGDSFRWPAAIFAAIEGRHFRLIGDLEQAILDARRREAHSVTLFAPPAAVSSTLVESLYEPGSLPPLRFGLITGRNEVEVWSWILRRCMSAELYRENSGVTVLGTEEDRWLLGSVEHFHAETDVDAESLENVLQTPMDSLILKFHSKESCGLFGKGILCGLPQKEPEVALATALATPGCAFGNKCLWQNKVRILMREINVCHLLAISCSSLRLSAHLADLNYSLGLSTFAGRVRSYLAPVRFIFSNTLLPSFAYGLLKSSESLGTIANELNDFLKCTDSDLPCFLLLGDPEDRPRNNPTIAQSELAAVRSAANVGLAPLSVASISQRESQIDVSTAVPKTYQYHAILDNINEFAHSGFFPKSAEATLLRARRRVHPTKAFILKLFSELVTGWARLDSESSFWLTGAYQAPNPRHAAQISHSCYVCGLSTTLHEIKRETPSWVRHVFICPRCGIIADIPPSDIKFRFHSTETIEPGQCLPIQLSLLDLDGVSMVACGISVNHSQYFGWADLPLIWAEDLANKNSMTWSASLSVPKTFPPLVYHLRAFLLVDGIPWFLSRPLIVLNRRSRDEA